MTNSLVQSDIDVAFAPLVEELLNGGAFEDDDVQIAAYVGSQLVIDIAIGQVERDSLLIPYSVSKNAIAISIGLLLERRQIDLDAAVAEYWPEFAAGDKDRVTVRQLLSHQAGLPQAVPLLSHDEMGNTIRAAAVLAEQRPLWRPGAAFGYHGVSIGVLASELVRRITGLTLAEFFEREIRAPRGIDFFLGLPKALEPRAVDLLPSAPIAAMTEVPFPRLEGQLGRYTFGSIAAPKTEDQRRELQRRDRAVGQPAIGASVSARGIAALFAEAVVGVSKTPLLSSDTVEQMAQTQVVGTDEVIGIQRRYGIVFQKPAPNLVFGGFRAFGHDGAGGALGYHDPETQISFGYTVRRTPPPGGADARALRIAQAMRSIVLKA
ncbi:CubicO group peptidase (beta-lactamase class C family) [Pseudarthrobacter siccitolerans]|uniref:CubicO group peptidase (Beta-lactamase class C family) n=1 Tax=Pseudarthrobacter siccitolerans TaxID=861266 RepID=A0ABU0PMK6_9MICC|nr:serine hydrolase domain-containing protein [Pseudarthrobacter siccitolerans]MDQ0675191.1 CubicO group peptidase (beta-lactamase class C family) [Pseudarthrobacter siccitolerans]